MSTSTLGREERKPLLDAFVLQRRILLICSASLGVSLILWIVSVSSGSWLVAKSNPAVFMPETRRYFKSSHSGLWDFCRRGYIPNPLPDSYNARNFTTVAHTNLTKSNNLRRMISNSNYINNLIVKNYDLNTMNEMNDDFRRNLFAYWVKNDTEMFSQYKMKYKSLVEDKENDYDIKNQNLEPVLINPNDLKTVNASFGTAVQNVKINGTSIIIIVPEQLQYVLFNGWKNQTNVIMLLWHYARDLEVSYLVLSDDGTRYYIIQPPVPSKKGKSSDGWEYIPFERCIDHEVFSTHDALLADPAVDSELVHYSRTQASFALITIFIMVLGFFFSIYTFLNPRYMFKRLAGGINFIAASTSLVVIQILAYSKPLLAFTLPKDIEYGYGFAFYLAYIVFTINLISGFMFMWYSKKKKGEKAPTEELGMADEPTIIGR